MDQKQLNQKAINLWTMFGFNYTPDFVEKAFADQGKLMIEHLQRKFEEAFDIAGSHGAFFYFWTMLSPSYQHQLEDWVLDNYKG